MNVVILLMGKDKDVPFLSRNVVIFYRKTCLTSGS